jgi:lysozyme
VSRLVHYRADTLRLSQHGADFIAREEGVRLHPYVDSSGWATAGVGHLIQPMHRGVTAWDRRHWTFPNVATAVRYFRAHDVLVYEHAVRKALGSAPVTQAQFDMCVSLCFNIGVGGFVSSRVARLIRAGRRREMFRFLRARWT